MMIQLTGRNGAPLRDVVVDRSIHVEYSKMSTGRLNSGISLERSYLPIVDASFSHLRLLISFPDMLVSHGGTRFWLIGNRGPHKTKIRQDVTQKSTKINLNTYKTYQAVRHGKRSHKTSCSLPLQKLLVAKYQPATAPEIEVHHHQH